jgi:hypothetical protein
MTRIFIFLKRKPGISFEKFREHYETSLVPLGERFYGHLLSAYRRNYLSPGAPIENLNQQARNDYDCVTELVFKEPDGYEKLKKIAADPEVHRVLVEDWNEFLDLDACYNTPCEVVESDASQLVG